MVAFRDISEIAIIDRHNDEIHSFTPDANLTHPLAIAVDQSNGVVFFTDFIREEIWRRDFKTPAPSEIIYRLPTGVQGEGEGVCGVGGGRLGHHHPSINAKFVTKTLMKKEHRNS